MSSKADPERLRARAEANFKKEQKAADAVVAWSDHLATAQSVEDRTARLRALRLAREAELQEEARAAEAAKPAKVAKRPAKKVVRPS